MPGRLSMIVVGLVALLQTSAASATPDLMPLPRSVEARQGQLAVRGPLAPSWMNCGDRGFLDRAASRLQEDVVRQTGLVLDAGLPATIRVKCVSQRGGSDAGEGYRLEIGASGIDISADGPTGVLRAFATLRQLVGLNPREIVLPAMVIEDAPRFAWRGVMLDPARHFLSVATIKRQIDAMERVKLNVLHLHLSDDEGFRVESRRYPRLTAGTNGAFYSQADVREIVAYAAERGVLVVPEFDVPGHSRATIAAYPEIGVVGSKAFAGLHDVALNPAAPATYRFLTGLFAEMAPLFPGRYFHVGGDEVAKAVWDDAADVKALMAREGLADKKAVEAYFMRRVQKIVAANGKTMIGWEEVGAAGVPRDVVVQAWQTSNAAADAAAKGHPTIVSAGYYLDLFMPADHHYAIDPVATSAAGLRPDHAEALRKRSPLLAAIVTDALIDFPHAPLTPDQERHILGAEAPLWGPLTTDELVDQQLWPRAAALAERFWSPASVTDKADMYRRLGTVSALLTTSGLQDRANAGRLLARLAPADTEILATLLDITGPVRNMAHDHRLKALIAGKHIVQPLNDLADAAPVDSLVARHFEAEAMRYVGGERALGPSLRARLVQWRENDARFVALAKGNPLLEAALPTSAQINALANAGLASLDALEAGRKLGADVRAESAALLEALAAQEAASWRPFDGFLNRQPPADLIVKIGPGIRALVEAASRGR
ncbi:MAG TPA: family 20 glycosylhydrolase [Sphingomonas sp.]|nr:family 20 glycosylhydrolase [Sphingomonas sp.]